MPTLAKVIPTRPQVLSTARLGSPRHFSAVAPFVRASLTLRRLQLAERPGAARNAAARAAAQESADVSRAA